MNNQAPTTESESPPPLIARSLINRFEQLISNNKNSPRPKLIRAQSEAISFLPRTPPVSSPPSLTPRTNQNGRSQSPLITNSGDSSKFFSTSKKETPPFPAKEIWKNEINKEEPKAATRSPQRQNTVPVFFPESQDSPDQPSTPNISPSPSNQHVKPVETAQNGEKSHAVIEPQITTEDERNVSNSSSIPVKTVKDESTILLPHNSDNSSMVDPHMQKGAIFGLPQGFTLDKWDARIMVKKLYELPKLMEDEGSDSNEEFSLCGYMDKLPDQKKMSTILKTWKRKYFKLQKGILKSYDDNSSTEVKDTYMLAGGLVEDIGNLTISVDDKRGRYFTLRCADDADHVRWLTALQSQAAQEQKTSFVKLVTISPPSEKKLVIMDMGSCSIRAGILCEAAKLPDIYIPHVVLVEKGSHRVKGVGVEAYAPEERQHCEIYKPLKHDSTWEKYAFDHGIVTELMKKVFEMLHLNPAEYGVLVSIPSNLSDEVRIRLADVLLNDLHCTGVAMCGQSLIAFHAFTSSSGVLVNLGTRTEIIPITEGICQTVGIFRQVYGGERMLADFTDRLTVAESYQKGWKGPVEEVLLRYLMKQCCLVAPNKRLVTPIEQMSAKRVPLSSFQLPDGFPENVHVEHGMASSSEGIFRPRAVFGIDAQSLAKQVNSSIQACPVDFRRTLYRSIYLCGGTSTLSGIKERLQQEITALLPPQISANIAVQVHAAPYREHAAFCGAWLMASTKGVLESALVTQKQWNEASSEQAVLQAKRQLITRWPK